MTQAEFLRDIVFRLKSHGIPFMLSGSFASSVYGEPRSTNDIDLVIDPSREQLETFVCGFDDRCYYVNLATAQAAWSNRSMFNVIEMESGWKTDLILKKRRPFSDSEFSRREERQLFQTTLSIVSPEDAILCKLEWAAKSGSERQLRDVIGMLQTLHETLDWSYLSTWANELGLASLLERVRQAVR